MTELFQATMDRAYDRWQAAQGMSQQAFWDQLSYPERIAVYAGNLNYQVENGGFIQWMDNNYAKTEVVSFLTRTLERMTGPGAAAVLKILKDFIRVTRAYGIDLDEGLRGFDDRDYESLYKALEPLNERFYDINDDFVAEIEVLLNSIAQEA